MEETESAKPAPRPGEAAIKPKYYLHTVPAYIMYSTTECGSALYTATLCVYVANTLIYAGIL